MRSKAIKLLIGCAVFGAILTSVYSCTQEPLSEVWKGDTEEMIRVGLYTNAEDYQTPVSRASANEGYDDASSLPWVFVFTGNDDNAEFAEVKQSFKLGTLPCAMLMSRTSAVRLLIVANAPQTFFNGTGEVPFTADNLNAALAGKNFTAAANTILNTPKLVSPVTAVPYVVPQLYIPMSGVYDIPGGISATTTIGTSDAKLNLTRIAAKVTVENSSSNFSLSSASVANAKQYGRLFQVTPTGNITGNTIDYAEDIAPAAGSAGAQSTLENPIYIYESASGETSVIVKGVYNSNMYYYKLAFKDPVAGSIMAVERNKWYQFKITSVSGAGYFSFAEAAAGSPSNVITAVIRVVDQGSYDLTDNGQYYVGLSNSALEIVSVKPIDYEFTAVTVTTDATQALIKSTNSISIPGTGLLSCSPTSLNLGSGTSPGVTEIKIKTKTNATAELGKIIIKLDNITKEIVVSNRTGSNAAAVPATVTGASGLFTSASVDPASSSWLSLVVNGTSCTDFTNPAYNSSVSFDFKTEPNIGSVNTQRVGTAFVTNTNSGRTKYYVVQNALDPGTVTTSIIDKGYVGTFHKWDQTGERVIRMSNTGGGTWSASVVAGDFIILDTETLGRTNTNDNTALTGDAETYKISGYATSVSGSGSRIYFRVGMTSNLGSAVAAPRYGVILVAYNNNTQYHKIYVRQGEAADFLMRNTAEDNPTGATGLTILPRTLARKFSPYNLTYSAGTAGRVGNVTGTKYSFTAYPSQGGYYYQWYQTYAWSPVGAATTNWLTYSSAAYWEPNKAVWEACPSGYRRPNDGGTTTYVSSPAANNSEWRQSLWLNPQNGTTDNFNNSVWGYLADGFFDRGTITTPEGANPAANTSVSPKTVNVAYIGRLFYNPNNNASLFFPATGNRYSDTGQLSEAGLNGYYWSSTSYNTTNAWFMSNNANMWQDVRHYGNSLRCVAE